MVAQIASYCEQMQKVFVGLERRRAVVNGEQVADVAVEVLQLAQVDLVLADVVGQGLVERDQVLEVDAEDGHLEAGAFVVNPAVVDVVAARRQQLRQLAQGLRAGGQRKKKTIAIGQFGRRPPSAPHVNYLGDVRGQQVEGVLEA